MRQQDRCRRMIHMLLEEMPQYQYPVFPFTAERQWHLLRSLMNVRPPRPASAEFLQIQDACLQEMTREKGVTDADSLACHEIMQKQGHEEPTGRAKITPGFNLPCKYVLHTVGPIVEGQLTARHEELLASCYRSCLQLASGNGVTSIAFCCISTGVFMFPPQRAAEIAVATVRRWLDETGSGMKVIFNVFKDTDYEIYDRLLNPAIVTKR